MNAYQVRSTDGKVCKDYTRFGFADKAARRLINQGISCGLYQLMVDRNDDGTDNLDTLRWVCIAGD